MANWRIRLNEWSRGLGPVFSQGRLLAEFRLIQAPGTNPDEFEFMPDDFIIGGTL